jgi:hypothetical protein
VVIGCHPLARPAVVGARESMVNPRAAALHVDVRNREAVAIQVPSACRTALEPPPNRVRVLPALPLVTSTPTGVLAEGPDGSPSRMTWLN